MNEDKIIKEEEDDKVNDEGKVLFFLLIFWFILSFIYSAINGRKGSKTHKSVMANQYGFAKAESLMKWIDLFCPPDIVEKYVGKKVHYMDEDDIFDYLGSPDSYPKLADGRFIDSKPLLAESLFLSPKTFQRRMSSISDLEKQTGITPEEYKSLKRIPPKQVRIIIDYFQKKQSNH